MKRTWLWVAVILVASLLLATLLGRFRGTASLPTRLDISLKAAKQNYNGYARAPDSVQAVVLHKLVTALGRATPNSLTKPTLVVAYVIDTQDGSPRKLALTWIADQPKAMAVVIYRTDVPSQGAVAKIPPAQRASNRSQARGKVVFSARIPLPAGSQVEALLKNAGTGGDHPFVGLQYDGKPCSNTVPCFLAEQGKLPTTASGS